MGNECKETHLQQELLLLALRKTVLLGRPEEQGPRNESPQVQRLLSHRGLGSRDQKKSQAPLISLKTLARL
nr:hypothetical protein CFP56_35702 [Quercus suber]